MPARKRSPHPGVVLRKPHPRQHQEMAARYRDPDSGKIRTETLPKELVMHGQIQDWLRQKAQWLVLRKNELRYGAPRMQGTKLKDALDAYFNESAVRAATQKTYKQSARKFLDWAQRNRVRSGDDLTLAKLREFRAFVRKLPKQTATEGKGTGRGTKRASSVPRSLHSVNKDLRQVAAVLEYVRKAGGVPKLSRDAIRDGLERFRADVERPDFLRALQCRALLTAALDHDKATFTETRKEHGGDGVKGSTRRYEPIAPFVAAALLSGMRLGELLTLRWSGVDTDAGELHLRAADVKTGHDRTIDLAVSPALRALLVALPHHGARVFSFTRAYAESARRRLLENYDAPDIFEWHGLRRTCGTFLANAPAIFGAASAFLAAKQLGHSIQIAERHYLGRVKVSPEAKTVEAAMQIEAEIERVIAAVKARKG